MEEGCQNVSRKVGLWPGLGLKQMWEGVTMLTVVSGGLHAEAPNFDH